MILSYINERLVRRVDYQETRDGQVATHFRFVYDNFLCVQRLDAANDNAVRTEFVWDPTEPIATRPLVFQPASGETAYYFHDGNKNVSEVFYHALQDGIAAHYDYAPFGAVTRTAKATSVARDILAENPFRFSSEVHDNSLGLVYCNYRHYNPKDGRWLGRDRLEEVGQYLFLGNTAVSSVDLLGMLSINEKLYLTYVIGALRGPFGWVWNPELPNTDSEGCTLISDDEGEFRSYAKDIVDNFIEMIEQETDTGAPFGEWTRKEASGNTEFTISPPAPLHCSLGSSSRVHVSVTYERKNCETEVFIRNIRATVSWYDEMDANSWIEFHRKELVGNEEWWKLIIPFVVEGGVDIWGDKISNADFKFKIEESLFDPGCRGGTRK